MWRIKQFSLKGAHLLPSAMFRSKLIGDGLKLTEVLCHVGRCERFSNARIVLIESTRLVDGGLMEDIVKERSASLRFPDSVVTSALCSYGVMYGVCIAIG
ncbi:hypothetical protein AXG93_2175s1490 [Marchantia polymorpha subsp. ruderalis]|uniref:Uncharacterized protein n=1 Tax=Marchantia polymorpha subsp. ruderalis TaxID=1480154 RepID=A0A176W835_MARPO|nr:hypothetical protein AXG93_2175s1490 [Marchantia polymorpha subsp. ruderalis]